MHSFRNIYLIFYKDEYLGSVDIAFSSSVLKKHMDQNKAFEIIFEKASDGIVIIEDKKITQCNEMS
ncbi:hypothetical protein GJV85_04865 [Sulfurimonas aquatica]|uniref:Uncharacterized protein n=1 Tax=Sulfurimonas aquatica TaxID=2672570 RepID=A0A975GC85_9BACT|nr:hypothetical protein [Sulfurimonas aquatica]QSZ41466.1 hypothetical protein GJV85_04865 [Sulfurimonas aquatica]